MSAKDYPITFGYGAQDGYYYGPNGIIGPFHRANDRAMPTGTPIAIGDTVIGLSGNTGLSGGPHCHTQAGTDEWCQQTVKPDAYEFKPGKVVHVGWGDQWGNFVIIKVGSKYICYAHLKEAWVQPGQVIKEEIVIDNYNLNVLFRFFLGRAPNDSEVKKYQGKVSPNELAQTLKNGSTYKKRLESVKSLSYNIANHLPSGLRSGSKHMSELSRQGATIEVLKGDIAKAQKTIAELSSRVDKLTSERNILDNQVQSLKKELADCQTAPEAPQDAVSPEVVPDTSEPEKPQEEASTQATEGFWNWLINLIRR